MDPLMNPTPSSLPPPQPVPFSAADSEHSLFVPSYPQMIIDAITALKERGGSSRHAIGKYIESVYSGSLPSNHRRLLTYHLDKMKADGSLGKSGFADVDPSPKRRPGRPREAKSPGVPSGSRPNGQNMPVSDAPPYADNMLVCYAQPNAVNMLDPQAQPIYVPIADVDDCPKRGRGRPPKKATMQGGRSSGQVKKPRKLSGNSVGRPKKNNDLVPAATQHLVAYQELKKKLEYFQSRIKQAVHLMKPYFTSETAPYAYGAVQELEELANVSMTTPTQAPPQTQPQQPLAPSW